MYKLFHIIYSKAILLFYKKYKNTLPIYAGKIVKGLIEKSYYIYMATNIYVAGNNIINIREKLDDNNGIIIGYSLNDTAVWNTINFPCYITNTNTENGFVKVYFTTDINITNLTQYFVCNSNKIQFGSDSLNQYGERPTINVQINYYDGFIYNSSGYSNILVFNLFINAVNDATTYSTKANAGWICKESFNGSNNYIINCSSNGNINNYGGGIVGADAVSNGGYLYIIGCSSSGNIIGYSAGGIVGSYAGTNNGEVIIVSCWSSGSITGVDSGGIAGLNSRNCQIIDCYSTGAILGPRTSGISGGNTGRVNCTITNCYSTGAISGNYSSGICNSDLNNVNITVKNCYTTGKITNDRFSTGAILGYITVTTGTRIVQNCYAVGSILNSGHIVGGYIGDANITTSVFTIQKCYSEAYHSSSIWNDTNASEILTGVPTFSPGVGNSWVSITSNTPYRILNMGYTPYSSIIINKDTYNKYFLIRTYSSSVVQGQFSTTAIINSISYQKLKITGGDTVSQNSITIDSYDGKISTLSSTSPEKYTIYISNIGYNNSLYFTTYELTVNILLKSPIIYMKSLFTDNSLVYYKPHSLSCGGVGTIKNQRAKCHKT